MHGMRGEGGWGERHQSHIENNLLRSEMRQLRGKDQKEKKKKTPTLQEPHT